jgi:hypothetical protein
MKALSVKQPWAWAIMHGGKDVENRPKLTHLRQPIAIHASQSPVIGWEERYPRRAEKPPEREEWIFGAIIGFVDIVDCVDDSRSKWFRGPYGYILENPRPLLKPVECSGQVGLWDIPPEILRKCRMRV